MQIVHVCICDTIKQHVLRGISIVMDCEAARSIIGACASCRHMHIAHIHVCPSTGACMVYVYLRMHEWTVLYIYIHCYVYTHGCVCLAAA